MEILIWNINYEWRDLGSKWYGPESTRKRKEGHSTNIDRGMFWPYSGVWVYLVMFIVTSDSETEVLFAQVQIWLCLRAARDVEMIVELV